MSFFTAQLLLLLALASTAYCSPLPLAEHATVIDDVSSLKTQYEYVVIGGGTSGLTVASRLTEDPKSKGFTIRSRVGWLPVLIISCLRSNGSRHRIRTCVMTQLPNFRCGVRQLIPSLAINWNQECWCRESLRQQNIPATMRASRSQGSTTGPVPFTRRPLWVAGL